MLDKVCHDFDIFGRLARARPAQGGELRRAAHLHAERADAPRAYEDGSPAYAMRDAGWAAANDAFHSDMDLADHQVAMVEYDSGFRLSFHSNSHVALSERRWYLAGAEGTLIADLVRNRLMVRRALNRAQARAHRLWRPAPPTPTTAPTRRWRSTSWPHSMDAPRSR